MKLSNLDDIFNYLLNYSDILEVNVAKVIKSKTIFLDKEVPFVVIWVKNFNTKPLRRKIRILLYQIIDTSKYNVSFSNGPKFLEGFLVWIVPKEVKPVNVHYKVRNILSKFKEKEKG